MNAITIRDEAPRDHGAIREVLRLAFSGDAEGKLVDDLRKTDDVAIALIAERQGQILGHVLFSRLEAPMRALALAPVGVHPECQNQGIGSALIRDGLDRASKAGWSAVFVLGEPAYYQRFGFDIDAARGYTCPYSGDYFMMLRLDTKPVPKTGRLIYPRPFDALG
jgi:putative acetyltransferase